MRERSKRKSGSIFFAFLHTHISICICLCFVRLSPRTQISKLLLRARSRYTNCKSCFVFCCYTKWWTCVTLAREGNSHRIESKALWFSTICCMFYLMPNWNTIFIRGQPNPNVFYICNKAKTNENISATERKNEKKPYTTHSHLRYYRARGKKKHENNERVSEWKRAS